MTPIYIHTRGDQEIKSKVLHFLERYTNLRWNSGERPIHYADSDSLWTTGVQISNLDWMDHNNITLTYGPLRAGTGIKDIKTIVEGKDFIEGMWMYKEEI